MMTIKGNARREEIARKLGEEILKVYELPNCPFLPAEFSGDGVTSDGQEISYKDFIAQSISF